MGTWLTPAVIGAVVAGVVAIVTTLITRRGAVDVATIAPYEALAAREARLTERVEALEAKVDELSRQLRSDHSWVRMFIAGLPPEHRPPPPDPPPWLDADLRRKNAKS
jgi:hypothetical protein